MAGLESLSPVSQELTWVWDGNPVLLQSLCRMKNKLPIVWLWPCPDCCGPEPPEGKMMIAKEHVRCGAPPVQHG